MKSIIKIGDELIRLEQAALSHRNAAEEMKKRTGNIVVNHNTQNTITKAHTHISSKLWFRLSHQKKGQVYYSFPIRSLTDNPIFPIMGKEWKGKGIKRICRACVSACWRCGVIKKPGNGSIYTVIPRYLFTSLWTRRNRFKYISAYYPVFVLKSP